jgi:hypothetical protein
MYQIVETTYEQKVEMYRQIDKEKLIEMLIECNRIIAMRPIEINYNKCGCFTSQTYSCITCNNPINNK